jgi:hypothetical protein
MGGTEEMIEFEQPIAVADTKVFTPKSWYIARVSGDVRIKAYIYITTSHTAVIFRTDQDEEIMVRHPDEFAIYIQNLRSTSSVVVEKTECPNMYFRLG